MTLIAAMTYAQSNNLFWTMTVNVKMDKKLESKNGSTLDVDFFRPTNSGIANAYASVRYLEKLEDLDTSDNIAEAYDKMYGDNSWYKDYTHYYSLLKETKTGIRLLRTDLSSL